MSRSTSRDRRCKRASRRKCLAIEKDLRAAYADPGQAGWLRRRRRSTRQGVAHYFPKGRRRNTTVRIAGVFKELRSKIVRWNIIDTGKRIAAATPRTVAQHRLRGRRVPRATVRHCSPAGRHRRWWSPDRNGEDAVIDALSGTYKGGDGPAHYNLLLPVGETGRLGGTKRREIGHGKLAWRGDHTDPAAASRVPYTVRVGRSSTSRTVIVDGLGVRRLAGLRG